MVDKTRRFSLSKWLLVFIAIFWLSLMFNTKPWQKPVVTNDVVSYYGYLPATFIYHDLSLKFTAGNPFFADKYWPKTAPNGGQVIKMSMGLSMMYAPFFFAAHIAAPMLKEPQDGYSLPYSVGLVFSCLFYLMLGLWYLRKLLLLYFSEKITSLTIVSVFFGTNLLWYSTFDGLMSHGYLFCMLTVFIYQVVCWHRAPQLKRLAYIGLTGGLVTLIRPTMILCFLFFLLFDVYNKQTLINKFHLFKKNITGLLLLALGFLLVLLPQLIYWKYITGNWFFFSYVGERFYFDQPHVFLGLLGFRKGWLIYTPIMFFAVAGLFYLRKNLKEFTFAILIPLVISVYVVFSWWCWWYGGSFGQRPMVDFYGMLALPMAGFYRQVLEQRKMIWKVILLTGVTLLVALNLFQTKQYNDGLIHSNSMTAEAYKIGFFAYNTNPTMEWYEALDEPDFERIVQGLPELISAKEIEQLKPENKISLQGYNLRYVTCEINTTKKLTASRMTKEAWEKFSLIHLGGNKVALKTDNGKYISADREQAWELIGDRDYIGNWETFELVYPEKNKIALKAVNGKYVTAQTDDPNQLIANGDEIGKEQLFRIYVNVK